MTETPLLQRVKSLTPMEKRTLKRMTDDIPENVRFLRYAESACTDFAWVNAPKDFSDQPMSARLQMDIPVKSILSPRIPPPIFEYYGKPADQEHIYRSGAEVLLVSDLVLNCLDRLDRNGFEQREVTIEGNGNGHAYALVLPTRSIDPIDLSRTSVDIESAPVIPGATIYIRHAWFNEGYSVRDDLPSNQHLFRNTYNADILFSMELIECFQSSGAFGGAFERTEGSRAPPRTTICL